MSPLSAPSAIATAEYHDLTPPVKNHDEHAVDHCNEGDQEHDNLLNCQPAASPWLMRSIDPYVLRPGDTIHGITRERIRLPPDVAGWLEGRSRYPRLGLAS
jgi:deoxycytidine triphosphate deaminase